ncbi:MAG: methyltransferase domain-containing protein [Anaerolineales bacterium]|nr:methyltransferase domain-containing protein [Anaerolineales bacterium]
MTKDFLWLNMRELPYFRGTLRAVEGRLVSRVALPEPIIDLGCGDGHFASVTYTQKLSVGLDPSLKAMREAQKRGAYRLLIHANGGSIPFADGAFSSALSNSVLEHIPNLEDVLQEIGRVLKPGAPFVFTVPNPGYRSMLSVPNVLRGVGLKPLASAYEDWFMWMSRTINLFYEEEWIAQLERAEFQVEETFRYFSPSALRALEWGHYFGVPCVLARWTTGRWILSPTRWNLWLTEKAMRRYYEESPSDDGTYSFYLARRR